MHGESKSMPLRLRRTRESDLPFVREVEQDPENTPFISQWTTVQHADAIRRGDREHWIIESDGRGPLGYLIAYDLKAQDSGVYVKRIVVSRKGAGLGRAAMAQFLEHAYRDLGTDYVWLAVRKENERAQRSYLALDFEYTKRSERARECLAAGRDPENPNLLMIRYRDGR
jgi:ribosomal protein S18 acetylase RimI-like enzyme